MTRLGKTCARDTNAGDETHVIKRDSMQHEPNTHEPRYERHGYHYEIKQQQLPSSVSKDASVRRKAQSSASVVPDRRTVSRGTASRFEELFGGEAVHFHPRSGTRPSWPPP